MKYTLVTDYIHKGRALRDSLADFGRQLFGIELFRRSETLEVYPVEYIPFSFALDGRIVANISLGKVNLMLMGQERKAHIVQTVGVLPDFRGQGLIRELFGAVKGYIEMYGGLSFLLAHTGVGQFYPRFGYEAQIEYGFSAPAPQSRKFSQTSPKVALRQPQERQRFVEYAEHRVPVSQVFGTYRQSELLLWFCDSVYEPNLSYLPELDCYVISRIQGNTLVLIDIIGPHIPALEELYPFLGEPGLEKLRFEFTPDLLCERYDSRPHPNDDVFFFQGNFPTLLPPFYVPATLRG